MITIRIEQLNFLKNGWVVVLKILHRQKTIVLNVYLTTQSKLERAI